MSRSKWKGPFVNSKLIKEALVIKKKFQNNIKTVYRHSEVIPRFVGMSFSVYNGKKFSKVNVIEEMVGFKFGEFSPTRKKFGFKKKKRKKKT